MQMDMDMKSQMPSLDKIMNTDAREMLMTEELYWHEQATLMHK